MGLFDGLFGDDESAEFDLRTPFDFLPGFLSETGQDIGTGSFDLFRDLITSGETPASEELFSRSRTRTLADFERATENAGLSLNRLGLASSGERDRTFASLALSLGDVLAAQDAQRAERQVDRQLLGATQGLSAINSLAGGSVLIPRHQQSGLFDGLGTSLIGLGTSGVLGGLAGGIGGAVGGTGFGSGFSRGFGDVFSNVF